MGIRTASTLLIALFACACGDDADPPQPSPPDTGAADGGVADAGVADISLGPDAPASEDAAPADAGPDVESPLRVEVTIDVEDFEHFYEDPEDRDFEPEVRVEFEGDEYEDVQMEVHGGYARSSRFAFASTMTSS